MSLEEALAIIKPVAQSAVVRMTCLDDKFWVWETIEEAIRPYVLELNKEDLESVQVFFAQH